MMKANFHFIAVVIVAVGVILGSMRVNATKSTLRTCNVIGYKLWYQTYGYTYIQYLNLYPNMYIDNPPPTFRKQPEGFGNNFITIYEPNPSTIEAITENRTSNCNVNQVRFEIDGPNNYYYSRTEYEAPYFLFGNEDNYAKVHGKILDVGAYKLTVTPDKNQSLRQRIQFEVWQAEQSFTWKPPNECNRCNYTTSSHQQQVCLASYCTDIGYLSFHLVLKGTTASDFSINVTTPNGTVIDYATAYSNNPSESYYSKGPNPNPSTCKATYQRVKSIIFPRKKNDLVVNGNYTIVLYSQDICTDYYPDLQLLVYLNGTIAHTFPPVLHPNSDSILYTYQLV